jgi:hypothetical protein
MKRKWLLAIMVFSLGSSWWCALGGSPVYVEGFSSDPNWITDQPGNFYWDSADQVYVAKVENHVPSYQPSRYAYVSTSLDGSKSFRLEWDEKVIASDWSSMPEFGLFGPDLANGNDPRVPIVSQSTANLQFENEDRGLILFLHAVDSSGNHQATMDLTNKWSLNTWYRCILEYDPTTDVLSATVTDLGSNQQLSHMSLSNAGPFRGEMRNLGTSHYPFAQGGYTGVSSSAVATMLIDNVVLTPEPATLALLGLGGLGLLRGRPRFRGRALIRRRRK